MYPSNYLLLALGVATSAYAAPAATNSVFYAAYEGQNPGGGVTGCTGGNLGTVQASGTGTRACKIVGEGACVTLTGHQGDATKCKVFTYSDQHCTQNQESTIFGKNGEYANENFASFKAQCFA